MNLGDNGIGVTIFVTGIWITHVCLRTGPDEAHLSDDCLSGHFLFFRVFPYFYRALSLRIFLHAFRLRISEFCSVKLLLVVCWLSEILTVCVYERPACFGGNWPTPIAASFKIAHCFFSRSEILPVGFVWVKKLHGFVLFLWILFCHHYDYRQCILSEIKHCSFHCVIFLDCCSFEFPCDSLVLKSQQHRRCPNDFRFVMGNFFERFLIVKTVQLVHVFVSYSTRKDFPVPLCNTINKRE